MKWYDVFLYLSESDPWESDPALMELMNNLLKEQYLSSAHLVMHRGMMMSALQIRWEYLQLLVQPREERY